MRAASLHSIVAATASRLHAPQPYSELVVSARFAARRLASYSLPRPPALNIAYAQASSLPLHRSMLCRCVILARSLLVRF